MKSLLGGALIFIFSAFFFNVSLPLSGLDPGIQSVPTNSLVPGNRLDVNGQILTFSSNYALPETLVPVKHHGSFVFSMSLFNLIFSVALAIFAVFKTGNTHNSFKSIIFGIILSSLLWSLGVRVIQKNAFLSPGTDTTRHFLLGFHILLTVGSTLFIGRPWNWMPSPEPDLAQKAHVPPCITRGILYFSLKNCFWMTLVGSLFLVIFFPDNTDYTLARLVNPNFSPPDRPGFIMQRVLPSLLIFGFPVALLTALYSYFFSPEKLSQPDSTVQDQNEKKEP